MLRRYVWRLGSIATLLVLAMLAVTTASAELAQVRASGSSPFGGCAVLPTPGEQNYVNAEVEPWVAVNPRDRDNIIGVWQQDRWGSGGARGLLTGVSRDGGQSWERNWAHFTSCSGGNAQNGGNYERASDPWVTFSPNGHAFQIALSFDFVKDLNQAILVSRSTNDGAQWSEPVALLRDTNPNVGDDKESITADPKDSRFVYAVWDRLVCTDPSCGVLVNGPTWFARTTNGGASWEPAHIIYDPGPDAQTISNQIVVLPTGELVNVLVRFLHANEGSPATGDRVVAVLRSSDKGETWSAPVVVSSEQSIGVIDQKNGMALRTGNTVPDIAVDRETGTLYIVWEDARFSGGAREGIVLSRSTDRGLTWSGPVQINRAPQVPAFTPAVQVGEDGAVAVTYYDLRKDNANPNVLLTDYWQLTSSDGGPWKEQHLAGSFDMTTAPNAGGYFVGDYEALSAAHGSFLPFFVRTNSGNLRNRTDVFAILSGEQGDPGAAGPASANPQAQAAPQAVQAHRAPLRR